MSGREAKTLKTELEKLGKRTSATLAKSWPRAKGKGITKIEITVTVTFAPGKGFGV